MKILQPRLQERDWVVKRQAALCLSEAAALVGTRELGPVVPELLPVLLTESSGRFWVSVFYSTACNTGLGSTSTSRFQVFSSAMF